jgi:hypothetical protein
VEVGLIDVDQDDLPLAGGLIELHQLLDMGSSLVGVGLAQQFLDLLPRQPGPLQRGADGVAAGAKAKGFEQVQPELLGGPEVAGQAVVDRRAVLDGIDEPLYLVGRKRGALPPVWR